MGEFRVMFWTDWGIMAKIERASMDGDDRRTVHEAGLSQPNGITIDYSTLKIYWSDSDLDKIEYSNYDGSERTLLESLNDGILHPFGLTIVNELLFWTDWETNYLYYTHKDHGNSEGLGIFQPLAHFTSSPHGVEALDDSRQASGKFHSLTTPQMILSLVLVQVTIRVKGKSVTTFVC